MNWYYVEFEEDYDFPDDPDIVEACVTSADDDVDDGMFRFVVSADNLEEAIEKALIEYRDMVELETSFPDLIDDFDRF